MEHVGVDSVLVLIPVHFEGEQDVAHLGVCVATVTDLVRVRRWNQAGQLRIRRLLRLDLKRNLRPSVIQLYIQIQTYPRVRVRARGHYDEAAGSRRSKLVQQQVGQVEVRQVVGRKRSLVAVDGGLLWRRENARVQN